MTVVQNNVHVLRGDATHAVVVLLQQSNSVAVLTIDLKFATIQAQARHCCVRIHHY